MFEKYATENEKEMKENLADQMLEANENSDQQEVERLGMEYKNIYIEVAKKKYSAVIETKPLKEKEIRFS